jgi:hypothetical protein
LSKCELDEGTLVKVICLARRKLTRTIKVLQSVLEIASSRESGRPAGKVSGIWR